MNNKKDQFLTVAEVADILKVTPRTVINMIHSRKLRALEISGKKRVSYRILFNELDRFVAEQYERMEREDHEKEEI